jgi:hypothetical protein
MASRARLPFIMAQTLWTGTILRNVFLFSVLSRFPTLDADP